MLKLEVRIRTPVFRHIPLPMLMSRIIDVIIGRHTATNHCTSRHCWDRVNVPKPRKENLQAARLARFIH